MRIAVPSTDDRGLDSYVSRHFGHTPYFTFIDIEDGEIKGVEIAPVPYREHWPGALPEFVKSRGADVVLLYGAGGRALEYFQELGIKVIQGVDGRVEDAVKLFLEGRLKGSGDWRSDSEFRRGCREEH